jgi:hypothetical protein
MFPIVLATLMLQAQAPVHQRFVRGVQGECDALTVREEVGQIAVDSSTDFKSQVKELASCVDLKNRIGSVEPDMVEKTLKKFDVLYSSADLGQLRAMFRDPVLADQQFGKLPDIMGRCRWRDIAGIGAPGYKQTIPSRSEQREVSPAFLVETVEKGNYATQVKVMREAVIVVFDQQVGCSRGAVNSSVWTWKMIREEGVGWLVVSAGRVDLPR